MVASEAITTKQASRAAAEGGSRAAGGLAFQANVTAWVAAHMLAGQRLGGLDALIDQPAVAIAAETAGPGDDLCIELGDGRRVEVQVKRGLSRGPRLWEALGALAAGVHRGETDFGLLVTCPQASKPILVDLARDLERIGSGRTDQLSAIGAMFADQLKAAAIPFSACTRVRIVALAAVGGAEGDAIRAAQALLRGVVAETVQILPAWELLARDALRLIELRGRRSLEDALSLLVGRGIVVRSDTGTTAPAALLHRLADWAHHTNATYSIVGLAAPLPIDSSWLVQTAHILADPVADADSFTDALLLYRNQSSQEVGNRREDVHGSTLGRFVRHCVVLAGPGMGKTTLLTKLARTYAAEGLPVLKVRLRALAERMRTSGCGFEEGLFALGCDSSGVSAAAAREAGFTQWVVLCDGLDECGSDRGAIANGIASFARAHACYRVIVTSRTIGYQPGALAGWRHYALSPLTRERLSNSVAPILHGLALGEQAPDVAAIVAILQSSPAITEIAGSPLLLGLATALALGQGSIGRTEADLYSAIFAMVEKAAVARAGQPGLTDTEIARVIAVIGHALVMHPAESSAGTLDRAARQLARDFGCTRLEARRRCDLALTYWCEVGLLERIHHQNNEMLAFVHKTFGEFACARYICEAEAGEYRTLIAEAVALQADPVVDFVAALGLAAEAFDQLLGGPSPWDPATVMRALALLNHAQPSDVAGFIDALLARAFALLSSASRNELDRIGGGVVAVRSEHREALLAACRSHLDDPSPDVRLVAWTCLIDADVTSDRRQGLLAFAKELAVPVESRRERELLLGGVRGRPPVPELLLDFAVKLADHLLGERNSHADDAVVDLLRHPGLNMAGFLIKLEPVLERHRRDDVHEIMRRHWYGEKPFLGLGLEGLDIDGFADAMNKFEVVQLEALAGDALPDFRITASTTSVFPQLSAYRELTNWGESHAGDVWQWRRESWREVEREVIRAVARLGTIDSDKIAVEAATWLVVRDKFNEHKSIRLFDRTGAVDVLPLDWRAARDLPLDRWKIEQALHHGSEFLLRLAVNLLDAVLSEEERSIVVQRTLKDGKGDTLWAAAELAKGLPAATAVPLALERLAHDAASGAEYMFNIIEHHAPILEGRIATIVGTSLTAPRPRVAIGAASTIGTLGASESFRELLFAAIDHWTTNPPARPKVGEPPDPRREIAKTLADGPELADPELARLLPYREGTVRDLVTARWLHSRSFRDLLLDQAERGALSAYHLSAMLEHPVTLSPRQRAAAVRLAASADPKMRRAVVKLFAWPGFPSLGSRTALRTLASDPEPEIAMIARALLDGAPAGD